MKKPRTPPSPYMSFIEEKKKEYPDLKMYQQIQLFNKLWDELDDVNKEKYRIEYLFKMKKYEEEMREYRDNFLEKNSEIINILQEYNKHLIDNLGIKHLESDLSDAFENFIENL